ncbi:ROK family protein [Richelia sinica FACHB-800]|uniref:ROK family protein n=1 Tax=Richelia sinica FACHB-800 TaxID=1357546 RepID=A0A975T9V6_9NOST|nr:ROK family protein [Richelia sinica]MBD2665345.1 ROK family protein [Richelia sinica FACHB-800]QXE24137.1 ROK family protein [Richelia sinica FACHB-800]
MSLILALDFGGTKLAAATVKAGSREWLRHDSRLSPAKADALSDIAIMRSLIDSVLNGSKPDAIGVSFGGPVDAATGTVRLSHHVPGWENIPLQQLLQEDYNAPAIVDNDANVAAIGEHRFGAGQGYDSLFYITISTGVGGGWILNNQPWSGASGMAGEIGHMVVDPTGPVCLCGKRGCVERLASGPYIAQNARELLAVQTPHHTDGQVRGDILRYLVGDDLNLITGQIVSAAAAYGDELAQEVLYKAAWALGVGIGNVANLMNPQRFVLGGGVTKAGDTFWSIVRKVARETALPEVNFEVVRALLGDDAPLWGAVAMGLNILD